MISGLLSHGALEFLWLRIYSQCGRTNVKQRETLCDTNTEVAVWTVIDGHYNCTALLTIFI